MKPAQIQIIPATSICYLQSPLGTLRLQSSSLGLERIDFVKSSGDDSKNEEELSNVVLQLNEFFSGKRKTFDLPIHLTGSPFQETVWKQLLKIPFGKVISYEMLARQLGDIKVIRAAATANGRNPIPIIVPCHRVIGKDGTLTGYSGELWRKQWLLEHEGSRERPRLF